MLSCDRSEIFETDPSKSEETMRETEKAKIQPS